MNPRYFFLFFVAALFIGVSSLHFLAYNHAEFATPVSQPTAASLDDRWTSPDANTKYLALGTPIERAFEGTEFHDYSVVLGAGDSTQITVEQEQLDVVIEVYDQQDRKLLEFDSPIDDYGTENVCFVSESSGSYRVRIRPWMRTGVGRYTVVLAEIRAATAQDRRCVEATAAFTSAESQRIDSPAKAIQSYTKALELWSRAEQPYQRAVTLKRLGQVFSKLGDPNAAIDSFEKALILLRDYDDERQTARVLNFLGLTLHRLGKNNRSEFALNDALETSRRSGFTTEAASALNNLALLAQSQGRTHTASKLYLQALEIWRSCEKRVEEATTLHNLGTSYSDLGRFPEALDTLGEALEIRQQNRNQALEGSTWTAIGWVHHLAGRDEIAPKHFLQAIELHRAAADQAGEAAALDRLGTTYRYLGRFVESRAAYQASQRLLAVDGNDRGMAHSNANLGWLLLAENQLPEARDLLTITLEKLQRLDDRDGVAFALAGLARVERRVGYLQASRERIEEALAVIESMRTSARQHGARFGSITLWDENSEFYLDLLMEIHEKQPSAGHDTRAFMVSDLHRSRNFYEMLRESSLNLRVQLPDELAARERAVQDRINGVERRRADLISRAASQDQIARLDRELRTLLLETENIQTTIRTRHPRFEELSRPSGITLLEIQALLDPGTLMLSYILGKKKSFLFLIEPDGFKSFELPPQRQVEDLAHAVYRGLSNSAHRRARGQLRSTAAALSRVLLGQVAGKLKQNRLIVVGDGVLHYIPFAALPLPQEGDPVAIIDRHEVVHLPSAAALGAIRERVRNREAPGKLLAILADPVFSLQDSRLGVQADPRTNAARHPVFKSLQRLFHSRREAEDIQTMVPEDQRLVALDFSANLTLVRSGQLRDFRILHFATHGLLHEVHPELSSIALSGVSKRGEPQEGLLRLHEIYRLDLPADLVVLSACETALGEHVRGDGLVGLTRGFFYAGSSRLLVSLWHIHDEATAELLTHFYRKLLQDNVNPAEALRAAQLATQRSQRWSAPYFWAGFVLQGDWRHFLK